LRLAEQPSLRDALLADPGLLATAPDEFIRVDPSVAGLWRTAAHDLEVGGCPIGRGEKVLLLWGAANRDPKAFDSPDEVRLDRRPNRHLSFGDGVHRCLGAALARAEILAVLERLLAAPALELDRSVPIERVSGSVPVIHKLPLRVGPSAGVNA
jgi:cytochrome P450